VWDGAIPAWPLLLRDAGYRIGKSFKVLEPRHARGRAVRRAAVCVSKGGGELNNFSENVTRLVREGVPLEDARRRMLDQVRGNFDAFLAAREQGKPWCFWFGPTTTHRTWIKGSGKALWGIDPDALKGKLPTFLPDVPEIREDVADYLGEAQAFDAYVGVLLDQLVASGELERTIVIVSGDHGMPGVPAGKCNLYDFGTA
jgi:arylsulfatase A-like enzyme